MRNLSIILTFTLALTTVFAMGCNNKPPENAQKAQVTKAAPVPEKAEKKPEPKAEPTPEDAPAQPVVEEPVPEPEPVVEAKEFIISPDSGDSSITWIGYKVSGSKEGGFANFSGTVSMPDGTIESAQVELSVDITSMYSEAKFLTDTLLGAGYFEADKFPGSKFISTNIEKGEGDQYTVTGNFELHGINLGVSFPVTIKMEGDRLHVTTVEPGFTIDRMNWGLTATGAVEGALDDLVKNEVLINFDVYGDPA